MGELGSLDDDPGTYFGLLDMQLMSAANVALDIGSASGTEDPQGQRLPGGRTLSDPAMRVRNRAGRRPALLKT